MTTENPAIMNIKIKEGWEYYDKDIIWVQAEGKHRIIYALIYRRRDITTMGIETKIDGGEYVIKDGEMVKK